MGSSFARLRTLSPGSTARAARTHRDVSAPRYFGPKSQTFHVLSTVSYSIQSTAAVVLGLPGAMRTPSARTFALVHQLATSSGAAVTVPPAPASTTYAPQWIRFVGHHHPPIVSHNCHVSGSIGCCGEGPSSWLYFGSYTSVVTSVVVERSPSMSTR